MDDFHEPLVEAHSRLKGVVLGLCCIVTLIAFFYVLYKVYYAPTCMPKLELSIVLLSCVQLGCGVFYYLFSNDPFLHVFNKGVKVAQCELISWSCIAILLSLKPILRGLLSVIFAIFTAILLFVVAFASLHVIPSTIYFNAKLGIVVSLLWFIMSCSVLHVAFLIRRNLDLFSPGRLALAGDNYLDSFSKTKFQHFMLLSLVEFVAATVGEIVGLHA